MALRWQTFALLAVLLCVGLVAALHRRGPAPETVERQPPPAYLLTPARAEHTLAALKVPPGFAPTATSRSDCLDDPEFQEACYARRPSIVLSQAGFLRTISALGLHGTAEGGCLLQHYGRPPERPRLRLQSCVGTATLGPVDLLVSEKSLVLSSARSTIGTARSLPQRGTAPLQGTTIDVAVLGIPNKAADTAP